MLFHCDQARAVNFLNTVMNTIRSDLLIQSWLCSDCVCVCVCVCVYVCSSLGESFQLVILELLRKICRTNPLAKSQYIK